MTSRRSSILKPRKAREPLQDLNQLLPTNNDDEETTTTEFPKRRVSFASTNKVKEFESAAECVTIKHAPVYDERFSISSDSCQSSVLSITHNETNRTHLEARSMTNINVECEVDDIELTETVGKIYDISVKTNPADSSMDMTTVVPTTVNKTLNRTAMEESICPLNLTKSIATSNIIEYEVVNQLNRDEVNNSSMETTSVISHNMLAESIMSETCQYDPDTENLCMEISVQYDNQSMPEPPQPTRKSIFHPVEGGAPRKSIFELSSLQPKFEFMSEKANETTCQTNHESVSMDMSALQIEDEENVPPQVSTNSFSKEMSVIKPAASRKSIFSQPSTVRPLESPESNQKPMFKKSRYSGSNRNIFQSAQKAAGDKANHNLSMPVLSQSSQNKTLFHNSSIQLCSQYENKTQFSNSSMQLASQELKVNIQNCTLPGDNLNGTNAGPVPGENNKTQYLDSSMQLASQNDNEIQHHDITEHLPSEGGNKTVFNNSSMHLMSQEVEVNIESSDDVSNVNKLDLTRNHELPAEGPTTENKTVYHDLSMQLASQNVNESEYPESCSQATSQNENKTRYNQSNMELLSQEIQGKMDDCNLTKNVSIDETAHNQSKIADISVVKSNETGLNKTEYLNSSIMSITQTQGETTPTNSIAGLATVGEELVEEALNVETMRNDEPLEEQKCQAEDTQSEIIQKSLSENNSSASDSNSPLTVGVNFSIFQKNKETRVEFSGTIDSNKEQKSKSISNVQVNIINNKKTEKKDRKRELRFSMPASKATSNNSKPPCVYASFVDFSVPSKDEEDAENFNIDPKSISIVGCEEVVELTKLDLQTDVPVPQEELTEFSKEVQFEQPCKKRLSSDMLDNEEATINLKRRSFSTLEAANEAPDDVEEKQSLCSDAVAATVYEAVHVEAPEVQTCIQTVQEVRQRRASFVCEERSLVNVDNVYVETCSKIQTITCTSTSVCYENSRVEVPSVNDDNECVKSAVQSDTESPQTPPPLRDTVDDVQLNANKLLQSSAKTEGTDSNEFAVLASDPLIKDLSIEIVSDGFSDQSPLAALHSTPYSRKSIKSTGRQSVYETDFEDNTLNNPSIIVNIGDSSHYKSLENVSTSEARDSSKENSDVMKNLRIENIAYDNMSKENLVTDWLQNKTSNGKFENKSFIESTKKLEIQTNIKNKFETAVEPIEEATTHVKELSIQKIEQKEHLMEQTSVQPEEIVKKLEDVQLDTDTYDEVAPQHQCNKEKKGTLQEIDHVQGSKVPPRDEVRCETIEVEVQQDICVVEQEEINLASEMLNMSIEGDGVANQCAFDYKEFDMVADWIKEKRRKRLNSDADKCLWYLKEVTEGKWIFEFRRFSFHIGKFLQLIVEFTPNENTRQYHYESTKCDAVRLHLSEKSLKEHGELKNIALKWLKRTCKEKLSEKLCGKIGDVPHLLELLSKDAERAVGFVKDLIRLETFEGVKVNQGKASFTVASFRNFLMFTLEVNIKDLYKFSFKDISVKEEIGQIDEKKLRKIAELSEGRDCNFFSKFIIEVYKVFDS